MCAFFFFLVKSWRCNFMTRKAFEMKIRIYLPLNLQNKRT